METKVNSFDPAKSFVIIFTEEEGTGKVVVQYSTDAPANSPVSIFGNAFISAIAQMEDKLNGEGSVQDPSQGRH